MARGKGSQSVDNTRASMPKFVDIPLSPECREAFLAWEWDHEGLVVELQRLCDSGYRVGCTWVGESQSYTVSLTCRDSDSVNTGLCMTSFARTLEKAVALAVFKHLYVAEGNWLGVATPPSQEFG